MAEAIRKHHAAQRAIDVDDDLRRATAADTQYQQFQIIQEFYDKFGPLIALYMRMHNRNPDQAG